VMSIFEKLEHQISASRARLPMQSISVAVARAGDVDEFVDSVLGYQIGIMQIDRGPFLAEAVQTQVDGVLLTAAHFSRAVVQTGAAPPGAVTFAMRISATPATWQGRTFGWRELLVGRPGVEIDMVSKPGYGAATASFPVDVFDEAADRFGWLP